MQRSKKNIVKKAAAILAILMAGLATGPYASAQTTWDGGGGDTNWTTPANWDNDTLPSFDGSENLTFGTGFGSGLATQLNGDKAVDILTVSTNQAVSINGDTLTLNSGINRTDPTSPMTINSDIMLGGNNAWDTVGNNGYMVLNGNIDDGANDYSISFTEGRWDFNGAKTWSGGVNVNTNSPIAVFLLDNSGNFGTGKVSLNGGRYLGNVTFANDLALTGSNLITMDNGLVFNGAVDPIATDLNLDAFLTINGNISQVGGPHLLTLHNRTLVLGGNNTLTGDVVINNGARLQLDGNNAFAGTITMVGPLSYLRPNVNGALGTATVIYNQGWMAPSTGTPVLPNDLVINTANYNYTGLDHTFTGNVALNNDVTIARSGGGAKAALLGDITEDVPGRTITIGGGQVSLGGNNNFSGDLTILTAGQLNLGSDTAAGSGTIIVNAGATRLTAFGGPVNLANNVIWNRGNWENSSNQLSVGSVTISNDLNMVNWLVTDIVEFKGGIIEASAGLNAGITGVGTVIIGPGSTYSGNYSGGNSTTTIVEGNAALGNPASQSVFGTNAVLALRDGVNYTDTKPVSILGTGGGNGALQSQGGVNSFAGDVELRGATTVNVTADSLTLSGSITETAASTLTKIGSGLLVINGAAGHTGGTTVSNGDLQIGGSIGNVTLAAGTSLNVVGAGTTGNVIANSALVTVNNTSGTGTGDVTANGASSVFGNGDVGGNLALNGTSTVNPGNSAGVLNVAGNLTFAGSTNNYNVEILALPIGFDFDQIIVGGDVDLNSAQLDITLTTPVSKWQKLFIVVNDGTNPVGDTFVGLADGATIVLPGFNFMKISYFGDSGSNSITGGNDIVLYDFNTSIPEPATLTLLSLGGLLLGRRRRHRKA